MPETQQDNASVLRGAFDRGLAARRATVGRVFRAVETVLMFEGGQRTARRNAWAAVCADRSRARARAEASDILARLAPVKSAPGAGSR
ncbi:hypothetical protein [Embleya sp. NPDC020630]|uniref:hypothetical protein n=1 Tax=Embleya sp. NPDC020630 TaxID=3363979 RepID=UPI00378D5494